MTENKQDNCILSDEEIENIWQVGLQEYMRLHPKSCNVYEKEHWALRAVANAAAEEAIKEYKLERVKAGDWTCWNCGKDNPSAATCCWLCHKPKDKPSLINKPSQSVEGMEGIEKAPVLSKDSLLNYAYADQTKTTFDDSLKAIAEAQRDADHEYYTPLLNTEREKAREELKQADKNYLDLKNEFDNRVKNAKEEFAKEMVADLRDMSFRHRAIGKQRIENFCKYVLRAALDKQEE